jgi:hypothetical protein
MNIQSFSQINIVSGVVGVLNSCFFDEFDSAIKTSIMYSCLSFNSAASHGSQSNLNSEISESRTISIHLRTKAKWKHHYHFQTCITIFVFAPKQNGSIAPD